MTAKVPLYINGEFMHANGTESMPVLNPATQEQLAELIFASEREVDYAVANALETFKSWRTTPVPARARLMLRYQALLKEHHDELAEILAQDTGKTFEDAKGDVWRGI
ncbi:MAG: aldehyde dehydrogenase family protein, partial [Pseudomonadota bacterium]